MNNGEFKIIGFFVLITLIIFGGGILLLNNNNPSPVKIQKDDLIPKNSYYLGSNKAKITLVEFSDYECPACRYVYPQITEFLKKNPDKIYFIYRHFPLPQHSNSRLAAEAAEAAGAQGKFWEMHDKLFLTKKSLSRENLINLAKEINLKTDIFTADLDNRKFKNKVERDLSDGYKIKINQTPTFYLNGKIMSSFSLQEIEKEIAKFY